MAESSSETSYYIFQRSLLAPVFIMLIPLAVVGVNLWSYFAVGGQTSDTSIGLEWLLLGVMALAGFGILVLTYALPMITVTNDRLLYYRNAVGYTKAPVNLVALASIRAKRKVIFASGLLGASVWILYLVDDQDNHVAINLGAWPNVADLKQLIASSPTGSDVAVNDDAARLLGLV